ncbi:receptor-like protein kinase ANXUR2, partial [Trifolium medium]|nr:receptor-like protein kinase ANXUR2 [Trifolium medium]
MFASRWGTGGQTWVWLRQLRAWEEDELRECQTLLLTISLQDHLSNRWQWQPDQDSGYTVRGTYQLLTAQAGVTWMLRQSHLAPP